MWAWLRPSGPAELVRGWAIPCATDIAFSAMVARIIFPAAHPAIPFLLLLAIADDALGLVILAVFYPSGRLSLSALSRSMVDRGSRGRLAAASPHPELLAVRDWSRCAVMGGAVLRWVPSGPGACADRAVHASQPA